MKEKLKEQKLLIIFILFFLLLNFPLLSISNIPVIVVGIPSLYLYVFAIWLLMIISMYIWSRESDDHTPTNPPSEDE
jgi:hypothetical protein